MKKRRRRRNNYPINVSQACGHQQPKIVTCDEDFESIYCVVTVVFK
jgi:hypothetical protein